MTSPISPTLIEAPAAAADNVHSADPDVGEVLRRMDAGRALSPEELEVHIRDCEFLWRRAYEHFRQHHNPPDRDEALVWLHRMNEAILMRPAAVQAQRHAAFEKRLAAGLDQAPKPRWWSAR